MLYSNIELLGFDVERHQVPEEIEITRLMCLGVDGEFAPVGVVTCSHVPIRGAMGSLQAGAVGSCVFKVRDFVSPGFRIHIALSEPSAVIGVAVSVGIGRILRFDLRFDSEIAPSLSTQKQLKTVGESVVLNPSHLSEDAYAANVAFALDFEGSDQAVGLTVSYMGSATTVSTKAAAGVGSLFVNGGTGNYLKVSGIPWTPIWTLEGWLNKESLVTNYYGECLFRTALGSVISVYMREGAKFCIFQDTAFYPASVGEVELGQWAHFAVVANGAAVALYINGVYAGQEAYTKTPSGDLWLAGDPYPNQSCRGNFDCLRLTLGVARYASNFVPERTSAAGVGAPTKSEPRSLSSRSVNGFIAVIGAEVQGSANTSIAQTSAVDIEHGGNFCIYGTVELYAQAGNIPLPRRVRLHRSRDGLLVRETWSDAQGNYRFDGITDRYKYDVIAWDHEGLQQSVVANDLTPEVMP